MNLQTYIANINSRYKLGNATEHTFRGDLQQLFEVLLPGIKATNEPKRQACGAPDYILTKKDIPIAFVEAKDVGADLNSKAYKEQFDRYRSSLNNLIITDYLTFQFFKEGSKVDEISIAEITAKGIIAKNENFEKFELLLIEFCKKIGQTIKNPKRLAEMMAGKARLLADVIEKSLLSDSDNSEDSTLKDQMIAFQEILIHDITPKAFADVYAQTIAYGMFAARLHDSTLDDFSRQEAAELIPKSNPFLRKLFGYIAGPDIDDRIKWIVDNLVEIFLACDVAKILDNYGKETKTEDPIIHFYETFLSEYDPKLRKARGVWYTPAPVVSFIVRAVDEILKTEFDLPNGLADTSKTKIKVNMQGKMVEQEVHKVQILDPATGTGTFLAETIKHIHKNFEGQQGIWSNYVENHLIPRLNGFELLMASYAMAHLKLELLLTETGFKPSSNQRLRVYLTNSLEEHHQDTGTLFANWLSTEASEANRIKRDTPVMCVIGNPPYSVSSTNKNPWIESLTADYKKDLNERNIQPLSDDYIKFLRLGQHYIDKNGSGILAYISNNSFLDGIIHRQMRKSLLESFDKIYILDLHGNAKKKEACPDGSTDQNIFDIMQGVSINIFVKTGYKKKDEIGQVCHFDLHGSRDMKYDFLNENTLKSFDWNNLKLSKPNYLFVNKNLDILSIDSKTFSLDDLFQLNSSGVQTKRDGLFIEFNLRDLSERIKILIDKSYDANYQAKYNITDSSSFNLIDKIAKAKFNNEFISNYNYRPFDFRKVYYDIDLIGRPFYRVQRHLIGSNNIGIISTRSNRGISAGYFFITKIICDLHVLDTAADAMFVFPLYLYPGTISQQTIGSSTERMPNLNPVIVKQIAEILGLTFTNEKEVKDNTFAPIDINDYIYAVLHSPTYREKYKEFLKIDFPRVPYPKDQDTFWKLVKLGGEIRQIHLLESATVNKYITTYPADGDNTVTKISYDSKLQRVYINANQYFEGVPEVAWNFYIGGYQPAQKWLKDRKDRQLEFDDILHYQKIIVALAETNRLMGEVDGVEIE